MENATHEEAVSVPRRVTSPCLLDILSLDLLFSLNSYFASVFTDESFRIGKKRVNGAVCRARATCHMLRGSWRALSGGSSWTLDGRCPYALKLGGWMFRGVGVPGWPEGHWPC